MAKRIVWAIQSLENVGGTEAVSVHLMNLLCGDYGITLLSSFAYEGNNVHTLDPRIKVVSLGLPLEIGRFNETMSHYGLRHPLKALKLLLSTVKHFVFLKGKHRKEVAALVPEDALFIASSIESYMFAPKGRQVLFHYHFPASYFFTPIERIGRLLSRRPDGYVFLSQQSLREVIARRKRLRDISHFIHNPVRFPLSADFSYHHNALLFVGRLSEEKNPLFALEIAKSLKEDGFPFTLDIYGVGHLQGPMEASIREYGLSMVTILPDRIDADTYHAHDLLLFTSRHEGYGLVKAEANVNGLPVVSTAFKGPVDEVFADARDGMVIDSKDPKDFAHAIEAILQSEETCIEAKKAAFMAAHRYDNGAIVSEWKEVLDPYFASSKAV